MDPLEIINKQNSIKLLREISTKIAPNELNQSIIDSFSNFIANFPVRNYRNATKDSINEIIVNLFLKKIKDSFSTQEYDIHEMLKHEINKKGDNPELMKMIAPSSQVKKAVVEPAPITPQTINIAFDMPKYHETLRTLDRNAIMRDAHLFFDTFNRDRSDTNMDRYVFHFENSYSKKEGTVNALGNIRDVIEMEIYPFDLPFTTTVNNFYNKITLLIGEFKQGFIGQSEFHFMFDTKINNNNTVRLTPINPIFKLRTPITKLDDLTLIFKAPFDPVVFHNDIIECTVSNYVSPVEFTTTTDHNLESGDLIYFTNFTTADPTGDNDIIQYVNRAKGFNINKVDIDKFQISILDFSTITAITGLKIQIKLGSKRALIPLRLGCLLPQTGVTDA